MTSIQVTGIGELRDDLRSLGNSVKGLGNTMAVLVDQQQAFITTMQELAQNLGRGRKERHTRRPAAREPDADDPMEVDEEAEADDEDDEPLPVKLPQRNRTFKLTTLPARRGFEENSLKVPRHPTVPLLLC